MSPPRTPVTFPGTLAGLRYSRTLALTWSRLGISEIWRRRALSSERPSISGHLHFILSSSITRKQHDFSPIPPQNDRITELVITGYICRMYCMGLPCTCSVCIVLDIAGQSGKTYYLLHLQYNYHAIYATIFENARDIYLSGVTRGCSFEVYIHD